jgi:hypothetical protein
VTRTSPSLSFSLPGVPPPNVQVELGDGESPTEITQRLHTVIIEPDERTVTLFWRGTLALLTGPHDVRHIEVAPALPP